VVGGERLERGTRPRLLLSGVSSAPKSRLHRAGNSELDLPRLALGSFDAITRAAQWRRRKEANKGSFALRLGPLAGHPYQAILVIIVIPACRVAAQGRGPPLCLRFE
jgi:hypothetical protein